MRKKLVFIILGVILAISIYYYRAPIIMRLLNGLPGDIYICLRDGKKVDPEHVITRLDNGMQIIVNIKDRCVCRWLRLTGHWDSSEKAVVQKIIKPGFKVVEVGANFGCYTLFMADLIGKSGNIIAFEANKNVSKYLQQSVALNKLQNRITVYNLACGNKNETSWLVYGNTNIGGGHLIRDQETINYCTNNPTSCVQTKTVVLDEMIKNTIDLLKIDAEGYEYFIMQGAKKLITNSPHIIVMMEWSHANMEMHKIEVARFVEELIQYGFLFWRIQNKQLVKLAKQDLFTIETMDIVMARQEIG